MAEAVDSAAISLQEHRENLCAATVRALSGRVDVRYRGHRLDVDGAPTICQAPHLAGVLPADDPAAARGVADATALRLLCSDAGLHRELMPAHPLARVIFEFAEQMRSESACPPSLPGSRRNLNAAFEHWYAGALSAGLTESEIGQQLLVIFLVLRSRVAGWPLTPHQEDLCEATWFGLATDLGGPVRRMRRLRHDQRAYAAEALTVATYLADQLAPGDDPADLEEQEQQVRELGSIPLVGSAGDHAAGSTGVGQAGGSGAPAYRIFTTAHDRTQAARELGRPLQVRRWREQLGGIPRPMQPAAIARALAPALLTPRSAGWESAVPEGLLDTRQLTRLITSPGATDVFRSPADQPRADATVTLLLDCSGSMRRHAETVAALCDSLGHGLSLLGVPVEVLGFTTTDWHAAAAVKDWRAAGSPQLPGRLGGRRHLIFKDAATPWQQGHAGLGVLLRQDLYKEGLDGEAVDWAARRLIARPEPRKLLVVISDGGPMEVATHQTMGPGYLDRHLAEVVDRVERGGVIDIVGVGTDADLTAFYRQCRALPFEGGLTAPLMRGLVEVIARTAMHRSVRH
ncbi:cobalt chelatase [Calidifontibacter sp. DB0510]|uniref:Cobalt chelatase n=1 Tax=Metallococcus carri TaxID=1656884 RepID=A0A967B2B3_9MICO|nr:cobalt chelatase [Metallococcus carri]NHN56707.1 cobalt chelatase [Metallococcus carri]NOP37916.1 cobalt chelatase [Calidifontibacter sp. DB2511S]